MFGSGKLRTVRLKNQRTINDRVSFQSAPLPRDISAKCGDRRHENGLKISSLREPH